MPDYHRALSRTGGLSEMDINRGGAGALAQPKKKHPNQTRIGALAWRDDFFHWDISCPRCTVDCGLRDDEYTLALRALSLPARRAFHLMVARSGWCRRIVSYSIPLLASQAGICRRAMDGAIKELLHGKYGFSDGVLLEEVKLNRDERGRPFFDCSADCESHGWASGKHLTRHRAFLVKLHTGHATKDCVCWDGRTKEATPWANSVPSWMFAQRARRYGPAVPLLMAEVALYLAGSGRKAFKSNQTIIDGMALDHESGRTLRSVLTALEALTGAKRTMRKRRSTVISLPSDMPTSVELELPGMELPTTRHVATDNRAHNYLQPGMELPTTRHVATDLDKGSEAEALDKGFEAKALEELESEREKIPRASAPLTDSFSKVLDTIRDNTIQTARLRSGPQSPERDHMVKMLMADAAAILVRYPADKDRLLRHIEATLRAFGRAEETEAEAPKAARVVAA
jgi:hypothetical protein